MKMKMFFAGAGGQGALAIGLMIAKAAMEEGKEVTWLPSYGPEMRGGTANCTVVVSDRPISCPLINDADVLVPEPKSENSSIARNRRRASLESISSGRERR